MLFMNCDMRYVMENGLLLKKSQFNYSVTDDNGDLIICNFVKGIDGFCKVKKSDIKKYDELMRMDNIVYNDKNRFIAKLCEKGILVTKDSDELATVSRLYYEAAMDDKIMFVIMPTEKCNFTCKYCNETHKKGKMTYDDQIALLKYILQETNKATKLIISWFGGEPLVAVDIVYFIMRNIVKMCNKRNIQLTSDMTTNAYNLDAATFNKLYALNVFRYQITLDGLEQHHNIQRVLNGGEGTFNRIIDNLLYIKDNQNKYKYAYITIRANISKDFLANLNEFISFYRDTFGNDSRFNLELTPINDVRGCDLKEMKNMFNTSDLYSTINRMGLYSDKSINLSNVLRAFTPSNALCHSSRKNTYVIGYDLSIYKCTEHFEMPENKIGMIDKHGNSIINGDLNRKWFGNLKFRENCKDCFMLPCCYCGGCPYKRVLGNNDIKGCVFPDWKKEIGNAMKYIVARYEIDTLEWRNDN